MMKRKTLVAVILATSASLSIFSSADRVRTNHRKARGRCFLCADIPATKDSKTAELPKAVGRSHE